MPLRVAYIVCVCVLVPSVLAGQSLIDLGMMGGSGVVLGPSAVINPASQFRLDVVRLSFLHKGSMNLTGTNITTGFSPNLEFFAKFQAGETGSELSQAFVGFGGKYLLPLAVPVLDRVALWSEIMSTENGDTAVFYPAEVTRGAMVFQPVPIDGIRTNILLGMTKTDDQTRFLGGVNSSWVVAPSIKLGAEFVYGYYGAADAQELITVAVRAFSKLCIQVSPGYLHSPDHSSWMLMTGISFSTTDIEFIPKPKEKEIFIVPPIEEMEQKPNQEPKKDN